MEPAITENDAKDLGTAAQLLFEDGKTQAAALLTDARIARRDYIDTAFPLRGDASGFDVFEVWLEVPRFLVERFTGEVIADVRDALNEVLERDNVHVRELAVRADITPAGDDWREGLLARMSPKPTNQASIGPRIESPRWMEDRCQFRSEAELRVYQAFKRVREKDFPARDTFSTAPNPALVVPNIAASEPDLLIMYRGRVGIVQVDGWQHQGRLANEVSRDRVYLHSGIAQVDRIPVEDASTDDELEEFVLRFLQRLARS